MKQRLFLFFILLAVTSCRQSAPLTEKEKARITETIRQILNSYYSDIRKSGLTAEFNYLDKSKEFFWVPPGYSGPISYDSVVSILKQNAPHYTTIDNSFETLQITPLSYELVSYTGKIRSIMTDTAGKVTRLSLVETGIFIKRTKGWKLLSGQTSVLNQH